MDESANALGDVVVRMHQAAGVIERFFGVRDPWAVALRTDANDLSLQVNERREDAKKMRQRAARHLKRIVTFMTEVANDV